MSSEAVWSQLRRLFKVIDRGIDIARQSMSNSQKHMSIREGWRMFNAVGERCNCAFGISRLKMRHSLPKILPRLYGYSRGSCALQAHGKCEAVLGDFRTVGRREVNLDRQKRRVSTRLAQEFSLGRDQPAAAGKRLAIIGPAIRGGDEATGHDRRQARRL